MCKRNKAIHIRLQQWGTQCTGLLDCPITVPAVNEHKGMKWANVATIVLLAWQCTASIIVAPQRMYCQKGCKCFVFCKSQRLVLVVIMFE